MNMQQEIFNVHTWEDRFWICKLSSLIFILSSVCAAVSWSSLAFILVTVSANSSCQGNQVWLDDRDIISMLERISHVMLTGLPSPVPLSHNPVLSWPLYSEAPLGFSPSLSAFAVNS